MSNLGSQQINATYGYLLQIPGGLTASLVTVQDGSGNNTPLSISTTSINGTFTGGTINGMIIGGANPAAGTFTTLGATSLTLTNALVLQYGGTGISSAYVAGDMLYYSTGTALSKLTIGTNGQVMSSNGTSPQWVNPSSIVGGAAGSNTQVQYNNSGALGASSSFTWDGTTLSATKVAGAFNGSIGATTPSSAAFTTLSATGAITINTTTNNQSYTTTGAGSITITSATTGSINGFNIGGTTAGTGAFTTLTASADSSFTSTGALLISKGTAAQQPGTPLTGMLRYNTTSNQFEGYSGSSPAWNPVGGATLSNDTSTSTNVYPLFANATSGSATTVYTSNANYLYKPSTGELQAQTVISANGITVNANTISSSYTIAAANNGFSAGPVSVASGATVTVSTGSTWVIA